MENTKKVLVVDDEAGICYGLAAALQGWGYKTFSALNGKEALALAKQHIPDLILLDIMMPKMDGYEVLRQLKQDTKMTQIAVIMLTAKSETPDKIKASSLYANEYLTKPVELEKVKQAVEKALKEQG